LGWISVRIPASVTVRIISQTQLWPPQSVAEIVNSLTDLNPLQATPLQWQWLSGFLSRWALAKGLQG
jgi:hypothetical protein